MSPDGLWSTVHGQLTLCPGKIWGAREALKKKRAAMPKKRKDTSLGSRKQSLGKFRGFFVGDLLYRGILGFLWFGGILVRTLICYIKSCCCDVQVFFSSQNGLLILSGSFFVAWFTSLHIQHAGQKLFGGSIMSQNSKRNVKHTGSSSFVQQIYPAQIAFLVTFPDDLGSQLDVCFQKPKNNFAWGPCELNIRWYLQFPNCIGLMSSQALNEKPNEYFPAGYDLHDRQPVTWFAWYCR